jgi:transcriptional regulator with XRE-family HTH domain
MEMSTWRALPVATAALCWQPTLGTGGEDCLPLLNGTGALPLAVERADAVGNAAVQIDTLKEALRLSYSDVGKIFGVSRQTVHNWMKGENIQVDHQRKLALVMKGIAAVKSTLAGRKEFFNDRALDGEKNLVQLLAEDRYEAFQLLADLLLRSDQQIAMLKRDSNGKRFEVIANHFDPLD